MGPERLEENQCVLKDWLATEKPLECLMQCAKGIAHRFQLDCDYFGHEFVNAFFNGPLDRIIERYDRQKGRFEHYVMASFRFHCIQRANKELGFRNRFSSGPQNERKAKAIAEQLPLDNQEILFTALEKLSTEQREIVELFYFEGLSQSAISTKKGKSVALIKMTLFRSRQLLYNEIQKIRISSQ